MKRTMAILLIVCFVVSVAAATVGAAEDKIMVGTHGNGQAQFDKGYKDGYKDGFQAGLTDCKAANHETKMMSRKIGVDSYDKGYAAGYPVGYSAGLKACKR